jgi:hypothetical protein
MSIVPTTAETHELGSEFESSYECETMHTSGSMREKNALQSGKPVRPKDVDTGYITKM